MQAQPYQAPQANLNVESVYCRSCGAHIAANASQCPQCQASQNLNPKSKVAAGVLALLLGGWGIHRFYLGQWWGCSICCSAGPGFPHSSPWSKA